MTLGHTTNSAECARCVAFFSSSSSSRSSLPPVFPRTDLTTPGQKTLQTHQSRSSFERNVFFFFPFQQIYDIHWNSFFFTYHLIALLLLRCAFFFHSLVSQKKKQTKLFVSFMSNSPVQWPHTTGFSSLDHLLFCYLAGVIRHIVKFAQILNWIWLLFIWFQGTLLELLLFDFSLLKFNWCAVTGIFQTDPTDCVFIV
jgi:hypothetical protein